MCRKIRCDGESWKLFEFRGELNKAQVSTTEPTAWKFGRHFLVAVFCKFCGLTSLILRYWCKSEYNLNLH